VKLVLLLLVGDEEFGFRIGVDMEEITFGWKIDDCLSSNMIK
jgi:hypothetical protein